ncbi:hypothetical protein NA57DRAFT_69873 [Rhizodiscina lignyota]|uniref:Heterokaryon incompatibility domain-containing protein n=1 Tax=Rhizodiscina lignyota TaxID=1504668 RepID=A0A9P4MAV4_9PEZI|nr:hypothetical protein NA57DRAFT_69873 [Rhizodiscina lignyota]
MCWKNSDRGEFVADPLPPSRPRERAVPRGSGPSQSAPGLVHRTSTAGSALITLDSCRYCSDQFTFVHKDGRRTHIIAGLPKPLQTKVNSSRSAQAAQTPGYKAISYVWGQTVKLPVYCTQCRSNFAIDLQNAEKFVNIARLATADQPIWLDCMSINQDDPADVARQISRMGQVYADAGAVAVLLPASDQAAFQLLAALADKAKFINQNRMAFTENEEPYPDSQLSKTCKEFYALVEEFSQKFHSWTYWRRAWTFQEWAMAMDIDVGFEGSPEIIRNVKYSVLYAATLTSIYKLQQGQYAEISLGFSRGEIPRLFNTVKRLFPDELAFLSPDEAVKDESEHSFQNIMPSLGVDKVLGLRTSSSPVHPLFGQKKKPLHEQFELRGQRPSDSFHSLTSRLSTMLNGFAASKREARFEADLVACWASMCNLEYPYDKGDTYAEALQKVLSAIRATIPNEQKAKFRIFAWQANTTAMLGSVDINIVDYATLHAQSNAQHPGDFPGTPLFTGRADTLRHLEVLLRQPITQVKLQGTPALVQRIDGVTVLAAQMNFIGETLKLLGTAISGASDGFLIRDMVPMIRELLEKTPMDVLNTKAMVAVTIETTGLVTEQPQREVLWTVIPYDREASQLMVVREVVNGQLALIVRLVRNILGLV